MCSAGVDEVESETSPAGQYVASSDAGAMHADEKTANLGWRNLALIERDETDQSTYRKACNQSRDDEHSDCHAARCKTVPNDGDEGSKKNSLLPTPLVRNPEA